MLFNRLMWITMFRSIATRRSFSLQTNKQQQAQGDAPRVTEYHTEDKAGVCNTHLCSDCCSSEAFDFQRLIISQNRDSNVELLQTLLWARVKTCDKNSKHACLHIFVLLPESAEIDWQMILRRSWVQQQTQTQTAFRVTINQLYSFNILIFDRFPSEGKVTPSG